MLVECNTHVCDEGGISGELKRPLVGNRKVDGRLNRPWYRFQQAHSNHYTKPRRVELGPLKVAVGICSQK